MGLRQLKTALRGEITSARHARSFVAAREREAVLGAFEDVASVLTVLSDESERRYAEREALTRALVREHQRAPSAFWGSVLLVAYAPMLLRLRGRICGDAFSGDDLDQMVLAAFLEVVASFALDRKPTRIAMFLRQDTQRAIFRRLRTEQSLQKRLAQLAERALHDDDFELFATEPASDELDDDERKELTALLEGLGAGVVAHGKLEPLIATRLHGETLRAYVQRLHPELGAHELEAAYQRIKRERLRTAAKLRPALDDAAARAPSGHRNDQPT